MDRIQPGKWVRNDEFHARNDGFCTNGHLIARFARPFLLRERAQRSSGMPLR